jgi:hypothetical protein
MEIQIAIWTPDETHSSVRSWQPILMIITLLLHLRASSMRGREPRNAVGILLFGEGTRNVSGGAQGYRVGAE